MLALFVSVKCYFYSLSEGWSIRIRQECKYLLNKEHIEKYLNGRPFSVYQFVYASNIFQILCLYISYACFMRRNLCGVLFDVLQ